MNHDDRIDAQPPGTPPIDDPSWHSTPADDGARLEAVEVRGIRSGIVTEAETGNPYIYIGLATPPDDPDQAAEFDNWHRYNYVFADIDVARRLHDHLGYRLDQLTGDQAADDE